MNITETILTVWLLVAFVLIAIHVDRSVTKTRKVSYRNNRSRITWP